MTVAPSTSIATVSGVPPTVVVLRVAGRGPSTTPIDCPSAEVDQVAVSTEPPRTSETGSSNGRELVRHARLTCLSGSGCRDQTTVGVKGALTQANTPLGVFDHGGQEEGPPGDSLCAI